MRYTLPTGKVINIPDDEIKKNMNVLCVPENEAVEIWLEDNNFQTNAEQNALDEKASKIRHDIGAKTVKHTPKPRTAKISDEKKSLFNTILTNLDRNELVSRENIQVLNENKLIQVQIGNKIFKIDLVETRNKA